LASLFDAVRIINSVNDGKEMMNAENLDKLKKLMQDFVFEIFGLKDESEQSSNDELPDHLMNLILDIRATVKAEKNYSMADKIRDGLKALNIQIKDSKEGSTWEVVKQ
jgi:cysteinyl-tRNA synthetase